MLDMTAAALVNVNKFPMTTTPHLPINNLYFVIFPRPAIHVHVYVFIFPKV